MTKRARTPLGRALRRLGRVFTPLPPRGNAVGDVGERQAQIESRLTEIEGAVNNQNRLLLLAILSTVFDLVWKRIAP